jgi:hypothetical protein
MVMGKEKKLLTLSILRSSAGIYVFIYIFITTSNSGFWDVAND